jgi:hypothetical protein
LKIENVCSRDKGSIQKKKADTKGPYLPLLRRISPVLLAVPVRFWYLPGMYDGKLLGHVMQRDYMAVPGLRRMERFWEPVTDTWFFNFKKEVV